MTGHGIKRRGMKHYCVQIPGNQINHKFILSLGHSRIRDTLDLLINTGAKGCTAYDSTAPRTAAYVHRLRQAGVAIATIREPHDGPFPGIHARYVLESRVTVVPERSKGEV